MILVLVMILIMVDAVNTKTWIDAKLEEHQVVHI